MAMDLEGEGGGMISEGDDVYASIKACGPIDITASIASPLFTGALIKSFSDISKYWLVYILTEKKLFRLRHEHVTKLHMKNIKSLRCTLAVLGNVNLEKDMSEWEKKLGKPGCSSNFSREDLSRMKQKVMLLEEEKGVFVPNH
ncbi:unnamed protein product [Cuscuta epithymum]|uniref:Uncharacterized protein n=1 Tax=Cuscuta epithymum TaxID=186058 RepID=A0AAV0EUB6_9ASTE|nr:unnamed protein product [Cuscuta epithymum]